MISYNHHSPSSLNQFAASPALFVLERVLGLKQVVGSPAHRGTGVEAGVAYGLINPKAKEKECFEAAFTAYDTVSALSPDERKEKYRENIPDMVSMALDELRPYGVPTSVQGHITRDFPGLQLPILATTISSGRTKGSSSTSKPPSGCRARSRSRTRARSVSTAATIRKAD